jgi:hypothetical protein
VHGTPSICNIVHARYSMSCITWSSRPCAFILIPGCHEGAIANSLVVNLLLALHNKYQIDSIARLLAALLVFRPADEPACLSACLQTRYRPASSFS